MRCGGSKFIAMMRFLITVAALLLQIAFYAFAANRIVSISLLTLFISQVFGFVVSVYIFSNTEDHTYAAVWIMIVLLLPLFGVFLYFSWGRIHTSRKQAAVVKQISERYLPYFKQCEDDCQAFFGCFPEYRRVSRYLILSGFPLVRGGAVSYYPTGEEYFERLIAELKKAERFIFLEYFIIADGEIWQRIHAVLSQKISEGVDVRIIYDDGGSMFTVHSGLHRELSKEGIRVEVFNPVHRALRYFHLNYRNHRKIAVIDGRIAFTGGINIGDEYANLYAKHGYWKDTAVALTGPVVRNLTLMFLQMWDFCSGKPTDPIDPYVSESFTQDKCLDVTANYSHSYGYAQFITDSVVNNPKNPAESTMIQMIGCAKSYVYITTPYLILDTLMIHTLCTAAQSGVDVRIYTPGIPDKWYVHATTRSFYGRLLRGGVRIFEYTPGFMHAKMLVSDDRVALVGSVNMDFRSFYLHDECAVLLYGNRVIDDIKYDFGAIHAQSRECIWEAVRRRSLPMKILQSVLKLFSPLM